MFIILQLCPPSALLSYLPPHYTSSSPIYEYELHRSLAGSGYVGQTLVADYLVNTWIPPNIFMSLAFSKFLKSHYIHSEGGIFAFLRPVATFCVRCCISVPNRRLLSALLDPDFTHHLVFNAEDQVLVYIEVHHSAVAEQQTVQFCTAWIAVH